MKLIKSIETWLDNHHDISYAFIRIFLGAALFVRGWILISDPDLMIKLAGTNQWYWWYSYVTIAHLVGGFLLSIGFLTRFAALLQIPVLFGAVFFIHLQHGLATVEQSLELSALVLVLLTIFFFFGSGRVSVDNYIAKKKKRV